MSTTIRVRIHVDIDGSAATGGRPFALAWDHTEQGADNPRFYGDSVQRAIRNASAAALSGSGIYVDLRDGAR